jgi:hypothetical protein
MLAGDASEVVDQAEGYLKTHSLVDYYDDVALKALLMAQADLRRGVLDELRHKRIMETIGEVIEDLSDHSEDSPIKAPEPKPTALAEPRDISSPTTLGALPDTKEPSPDLLQMREGPVLCIAGRSFLDEAATSLFAQLLEKRGMEAKVEQPTLVRRHSSRRWLFAVTKGSGTRSRVRPRSLQQNPSLEARVLVPNPPGTPGTGPPIPLLAPGEKIWLPPRDLPALPESPGKSPRRPRRTHRK